MSVSSDLSGNPSENTGEDRRDQIASFETIITPQKGWKNFGFMEIWRYRELLVTLALRHIRVRYKQTVLGGLWAVLQPAAAAAAFTLVFRNMVGPVGDLPYMVFAYSGVLLWQVLASTIGTAATSMIDNTPLITKVFFPRILIPLSVFGYTLIDLAVGSVFLACLLFWFDVPIGLSLFFLPLAVFGTIVCALGFGVLLSALTIKYRDFRFVISFFLQLWFFLSPVVYPTSRLSPSVQPFLAFNPMTGWIELFRFGLFGGEFPGREVIFSLILSLLTVVVGIAYFRRVETEFADII